MSRCFKSIMRYVSALSFLGLPLSLDAATVTKVHVNKRVKLDAGSNDGFTKGKRVCFYGKAGRKKVCGKVIRSSPNSSWVKIKDDSKFEKTRNDTENSVKGDARLESIDNKEILAGSDDKTILNKESEFSKTNIKLVYYLTAISQGRYNNLSYESPSAGANTLWNQSQEVTSSYLGLGLEYEFRLKNKSTIGYGIRWKTFPDYTAVKDYNGDATRFAESVQTANSLGVYIDLYYYESSFYDPISDTSIILKFPIGLEADVMSVIHSTKVKDDDGSDPTVEIVRSESKLFTYSMRVGIMASTFIEGFGMNYGVVFIAPMTSKTSSFGSFDNKSISSENGINEEEDFKSSLDHKKSSVAIEFPISIYYDF